MEILFYILLYFFAIYFVGFISFEILFAYLIGPALFPFFGFRISMYGKLLIFLSPIFTLKLNLLFGPSLRLHLTELTVRFFSSNGMKITNEGNLLFIQNRMYSVDPKCEGLSMLSSVILLNLLMLHWSREVRLYKKLLFMFISFVLWYFANFIRILALVYFEIAEENPRHGIIGMILFLAIVVFPLMIFYIGFNQKKSFENKEIIFKEGFHWKPIRFIFIFVLVIGFIPRLKNPQESNFPKKLDFYETIFLIETNLQNTIGTYKSGDLSLLIKKNMEPFRVSHHPRNCFEASGFQFIYEVELTLLGFEIHKAELKQNEKIYELYWWYESDQHKTSNEWKWRKHSIKEKFIQVNLLVPKESSSQANPILVKILSTEYTRMLKE